MGRVVRPWHDAIWGLFAVNVLLGLLLATRYRLSDAHASVTSMRADWAWLTGAHYWFSSLLLLAGAAFVFGLALSGGATRFRSLYFSALGLFGIGFIAQLTGNLMPMDAHDVRTAVVEASIAGRVPVAGGAVRQLMLGGNEFGFETLRLWSIVHGLVLLGLFLPWIVARLIRDEEERQPARVLWPTLVVLGLGCVLAATVPGPTGAAATAFDSNSFDARPSWYVLPMHGLLTFFDQAMGQGWIGSALIPGLLGLALILAPWCRAWLARLPLMGLVGLLLFGAIRGGAPAPISGNQDQEPAPSPPPKASTSYPPVNPALVKRGKALFTENGCAGCHSLDGKVGNGGPDLTDLHRRHPDPEWIKAYIKDPSSVKKGSTMPPFGFLKPADLDALADYLRQAR